MSEGPAVNTQNRPSIPVFPPLMQAPAQPTPGSLLELYAGLRRWPDVEAENLVAVDAADRLVVDAVLSALDAEHAEPAAVAPAVGEHRFLVLGERYGAMALGLASGLGERGAAPGPGREVLVVADSIAQVRAIRANAAEAGMAQALRICTLSEALQDAGAAPLVAVGAAPRAHVTAQLWSRALAQGPGARALVLGAMVKHLSPGLTKALEDGFASVAGSRARQKARLLWATDPKADSPAPELLETRASYDLGLEAPLQVHAVPGVFGAERIDPGTRVLLPELAALMRQSTLEAAAALRERPHARPEAEPAVLSLVDLGCGNGTISAFAALIGQALVQEGSPIRWEVTGTDVSAAAVESTRRTAAGNGVVVRTLQDDALSAWEDSSEDLIVLNPPFHLGNAVTEEIAFKLFDAAARVLRPGGRLLCVWNTPQQYGYELRRRVGRTRVLGGNAKFTVTLTTR